ncbi:MAG: hypothetical protein J6V72_05250 [Kiritimatiellae bacterium]|nr:hypothetical protein [Kiritimatiellia bacterium]
MFCDQVTVDIGGEKVTVRRLTVKELRESREIFAEGRECLGEAYTKLIAEHCTTTDGKPVNAEELSLRQLQTLAKELAGVPEGSPLSDFIGLLC